MTEKSEPQEHIVHMENRNGASFTGVCEVISFDSKEVIVDTVKGNLKILGNELFVEKLNIEKNELALSGRIDSLSYSEKRINGKKGAEVFKRMFG